MEEEFMISDLETLKVISDPFRMRIMETIGSKATTVKQIAKQLDVSPKKLYYHINLLEKHGLVIIAHTQLVSGIVEKWYQVAAYRISIDKSILTLEEGLEGAAQHLDQLLNGIFDATRADISQAVTQGLIHPLDEEERKSRVFVSKGTMVLDDDQREKLFEELENLCEKYKRQNDLPDQPQHKHYGFTIVVHPTTREIKKETTDR